MNIFDRAVQVKISRLKNLTMLDRPFSTKDLYLNDTVLLDFIRGQEVYFYVIKTESSNFHDTILNTQEINYVLDGARKAISISLKSLKPKQFEKERKRIDEFIKKVGGHSAL